MKSVFILYVTSNLSSGNTVFGVYSSREKAEEEAKYNIHLYIKWTVIEVDIDSCIVPYLNQKEC